MPGLVATFLLVDNHQKAYPMKTLLCFQNSNKNQNFSPLKEKLNYSSCGNKRVISLLLFMYGQHTEYASQENFR